MSLKCGNGEDIEDHLIFVCHHCGMPLCEEHGWVVSADDAFDDSNIPVSRAAMHCRDCVEEHHRGLAKHHGWADPRLTQSVARAWTALVARSAQQERA
jgi:hypothetical protein